MIAGGAVNAAEQVAPADNATRVEARGDDDEDEDDEDDDADPVVSPLEGLLPQGASVGLELRGITRMPRSLRSQSTSLGAYDEILDKVEPSPGYLARRAGAPEWLTLGGNHRTRFESMDGQFRPGLARNDQQFAHRTRLHFAIKDVLDPLRFVFVLQDSRSHSSPANGNSGVNFDDHIDIQQAHVSFYHEQLPGLQLPSNVAIGRINMDLGRGRWFAENNFRNSTNAYDGIYWSVGESTGFKAQSFAVWPVDKFERQLNPAFAANRNFFWGTYVLLPPMESLPSLRLELDYIKHSSNGTTRDFEMVGYRVFRPSGVGDFGFEVESQYQFGNLSTTRRHAYFHHGEIDYTFPVLWRPELQLKFDYATPGFDILYGRRSFELMPTGIFGPFQRSNMVSGAWRILLHPAEHTHVYFQHRATWLADRREPWVGGNLHDPTGEAGSFLGHTYELRLSWRLLENVTIDTGYTYFRHGEFVTRAPRGSADGGTRYLFFATEVTF